jgi:hypothetical protein
MKITNYMVIVKTDTSGQFTAEVNRAIQQGWQPYGPIGVREYTYVQVMVKYEDIE